MADIIEELADMPDCRKRRAGRLLVKYAVEYFKVVRDMKSVPLVDNREELYLIYHRRAEELYAFTEDLLAVYEDTPNMVED